MFDMRVSQSSPITQLKEHVRKLSTRERTIISVAAAMIAFTILYQAFLPVRDAFRRQAKEITNLEEQMSLVSATLAKYSRLKSRQAAIETAYKEVEFKEGELSYLDNLIKSKAGIPSGGQINIKPTREFGGSYQQSPFNIKFVITDYPRLIEFLKEVAQGSRPMILSGLDIKKRPAGDALEVELDVSSVKKITRAAKNEN